MEACEASTSRLPMCFWRLRFGCHVPRKSIPSGSFGSAGRFGARSKGSAVAPEEQFRGDELEGEDAARVCEKGVPFALKGKPQRSSRKLGSLVLRNIFDPQGTCSRRLDGRQIQRHEVVVSSIQKLKLRAAQELKHGSKFATRLAISFRQAPSGRCRRVSAWPFGLVAGCKGGARIQMSLGARFFLAKGPVNCKVSNQGTIGA